MKYDESPFDFWKDGFGEIKDLFEKVLDLKGLAFKPHSRVTTSSEGCEVITNFQVRVDRYFLKATIGQESVKLYKHGSWYPQCLGEAKNYIELIGLINKYIPQNSKI